jgi:HD-GYP domain-containing protein (c-di-GMP phosphodiesterase class II)
MSFEDRGPDADAGPSFGTAFDATAGQATRTQRQDLGHQIVLALHAVQRNARTHAEDNAIFDATLGQLREAVDKAFAADGAFELRRGQDGLYLNHQALKFEAQLLPISTSVTQELKTRGIETMYAGDPPTDEDYRALVTLFAPGAARPRTTGNPARPFPALRLTVETSGEGAHEDALQAVEERLSEAYSRAVFFVARTIDLLRKGGDVLPLWAASRVVMDLVDLQQEAPLRFLALTSTKAGADAYWGFHAANVALLSISTGAALGLPKRRRHDLGMAALFHDVGMAALPAQILHKADKLDARERGAVDATPLFAARAILRDREVHPAALARALAVYECHLDLAVARAGPDRPGLYGRIVCLAEAFDAITTTRPYRRALRPGEAIAELSAPDSAHKFDPALLALLPQVIRPLLS